MVIKLSHDIYWMKHSRAMQTFVPTLQSAVIWFVLYNTDVPTGCVFALCDHLCLSRMCVVP